MTLAALLTNCSTAGVRLTLVDGRIEADGPTGAMTTAIVDALKAHKPALLNTLAERVGPCPRCGNAVLARLLVGPVVCPSCCPVAPEAVAEKLVWRDDLADWEPFAGYQQSLY